jgi:DNA-binding transcriptional ArsR family regulator
MSGRQQQRSYSDHEEAQLAVVLYALGHPLRLSIISLFATVDEPLCPWEVGQLEYDGETPASTIAYHTRKLAAAGLLAERRSPSDRPHARARYFVLSQLGYEVLPLLRDARLVIKLRGRFSRPSEMRPLVPQQF